jgi:hypothetical protein
MTPEQIAGEGAVAKLRAAGFTITAPPEPAPVVTMEEFKRFRIEYANAPSDSVEEIEVASAFVCRWLRARLSALPDYSGAPDFAQVPKGVGRYITNLHRADTFTALTGRPW